MALDPLVEAAIHEGHRRALGVLAEFEALLGPEYAGGADVEAMRALVAFLRQSVLPFSHWEEHSLAPAAELREQAAFEHAFLAAEIDGLAAEVGVLSDLPVQGRAAQLGAVNRVYRRLHRIGAVLELHAQKAAEHSAETSAGPWPAAAPVSASPGLRELDAAEVRALLAAHEWGVLSTVGPDGMPYAVPVAYGLADDVLYLACGPGRKARNLEARPLACLTVAEVRDGERWRSVVVGGPVEWVDDAAGRLAALHALEREPGRFSPRDRARLAYARFARLRPHEVGGRAREPHPG